MSITTPPNSFSSMKDDFSLPVVPIFAAVLTFALYLWTIYFKTSKGSPPGPTGLPVLGHLPFLEPELHTYFAGLARRYGPVVKIMLGTKPGIIVTSPSAAREVLKDHDVTFANRDVPAAGLVGTYGGQDIASLPYGPEWRMLRKVCTIKMLSNTTLDSVYDLRRREVRKTVRYLYDRAGSAVNVGEQMFLTTLNVLTSMMWGETVEGEARGAVAAEFRQVVSEMMDLLGKPNVSDFFPGLARFDLLGIVRDMNRLVNRFDGIFDRMIEKRMGMEENGGAGEIGGGRNVDFLQYLLKVKDEEDAKTPLTLVHVKALLMDMVVGGTHNASNTVEFAMAEVLNNPEVLAKVLQELDTVVGKERIIEESDIGNLPYLQAVIKETLRLHPSLPLLAPHCPSHDSVIGGYTVPKGSRVFVNVWAIQRDPALWDDPTRFDPGRFLGGRASGDCGENDFTYFPFGSGRRMCVGMAMGERMVMYFLANVFHSFDWKLPEGEEMDLAEQFGIALKKKVPLTAIPIPRLSGSGLYD